MSSKSAAEEEALKNKETLDYGLNDEVDDEEAFGAFPEHLEFVKMMRSSQKMANHIKKKVPISWRGYSSSVFPNLPTFTTEELKDRLKKALTHVMDITSKEKQVILQYYLINVYNI